MNTTIQELLAALTHDNWFTQLAVLSDAYRESGEWGKAERCDDLWMARRRPYKSKSLRPPVYWFGSDNNVYCEYRVPRLTLVEIDKIVGGLHSENLQAFLLAYLEVPENLRILREIPE